MLTPRKRTGKREARAPLREEVLYLRRWIERLQSGMDDLKKSTEDLRRGHDANLRRFGEIQRDVDALTKTLGR